jgi:lipopolysaccharide export system permease protein
MIPNFLIYTVPMSLVLAIILTFGRYSQDYEIIALKASGISIYQLLRPIFLFTLLCYVFTSYLWIYVVPQSNFNLKKLLVTVVSRQVNIGLDEKVFNNIGGMIIYVDKIPIRSQKLHGILVFDDTKMERAITIVAREGYVETNKDSSGISIRLEDGDILLSSKFEDSEQFSNFGRYSLNIDIFGAEDGEEGNIKKKDWEKTLEELYQDVAYWEGELRASEARYDKHPTEANRKQVEHDAAKIRKRKVEISERYATPFACIVFFLLCVPLGIQSNPKGRSGSMVLAILIIFAYYVLMAMGKVTGKNNVIPPLYSMWLPNVILGVMGIYAMIKVGRESPIFVITLYNRLLEYANKIMSRINR